MKVTVVEKDLLAALAASRIAEAAERAIAERGIFRWAAAGGGTPRGCYMALRAHAVDWTRVESWLGDERVVPHDHEASNARMLRTTLLDAVGAPAEKFIPFDTAIDPDQAARDAEAKLDGPFDLVLLGLGDDSHTASWFPGTRFSEERLVEATPDAHAGYRRITLTPRCVNEAREVLMLVSGAGKSQAIARVVGKNDDPLNLPAQRVAPQSGALEWLLDQEAASDLPSTS